MICALEGHSYSGKTTLLNYLNKSGLFCTINEHDKYAKSVDNYPPFPALTPQMAINSIDFFLNLEIKRLNDAQKINGAINIFDRSFLSMILFQKYINHLNEPGHFDSYKYSKTRCLSLLADEAIALPDLFIYIRPKDLATYLERQNRTISVGLLKGEKALKYFEEQYSKIFNIYAKYDRAIELRSDNSIKSLEENMKAINKSIEIGELTKKRRKDLIKELMEVV
jgi:deoxyadenosine/deoxycytidine kinase